LAGVTRVTAHNTRKHGAQQGKINAAPRRCSHGGIALPGAENESF
jgi:hypothetical protein